MTARWSIVSTMHGVPETVLPCIAHHLQTDAEFIHIYLDAPNPILQDALARQPRCIVTVCDDAYWSRRPNGRPNGLGRRQRANIRHAMRRSSSDWLVHIDSDEFLVPPPGQSALQLGAELASLPAHHDWGRIAPLERILPPHLQQQTIFDGVFRRSTTDKDTVRAAYGDDARFLTEGLSGHTRGKIAFRRNTTLTPRIHELNWPKPRNGRTVPVPEPEGLPPHTRLQSTQLLHFEGWTARHWGRKLLRFVEDDRITHHNKGRRTAIEFMSAQADPAERDSLFDRVQRLSEEGFALLNRKGLLRLEPFNPTDITRHVFPEIDFDFSVAAFDARMVVSTAHRTHSA